MHAPINVVIQAIVPTTSSPYGKFQICDRPKYSVALAGKKIVQQNFKMSYALFDNFIFSPFSICRTHTPYMLATSGRWSA